MTITQLADALELLRGARAEVQRYEFILQTLFKRLPSPLLLLDDQALIQQSNPQALATFGYSAQTLHGVPIDTLCSETAVKTTRAHLRKAFHHPSEAVRWPAQLVHQDTSRHDYILSAQAVELAEGQLQLLLHCLPADEPSLAAIPLANAQRAAATGPGLITIASTLPTDRPVLGKDLETVPEHLGCSITHCCNLLGIATAAWYDWRSKPEQPIPNRTVALHLRLLDAFPMLAEPAYTPPDLHQALQQKLGRRVTLIELSLLLGMERTSAYRWGRGVPPSEPIIALIARLVELLDQQPVAAIEYYRSLVAAEARLIGIDDIWTEGSWKPGSGDQAT
jgi:hypothetical protein